MLGKLCLRGLLSDEVPMLRLPVPRKYVLLMSGLCLALLGPAFKSSTPTCDARPIVAGLARSVGRSVDVRRYFSAADFAWLSDQGTNSKRIGSEAASYATLQSYFARLAVSGDRWGISSFVSHPVQSGVANFQGELARGRRLDGKSAFKGAVRCASGKIVALSIGGTRR